MPTIDRASTLRPLIAVVATALVAGLLAGCAAGGGGSATASPEPSGSATPPPSPTAPELPSDPDTLLIQVREEGGFVAPGYLLSRTPRLSIYADGRVIQEGAQIAIYPGPLLPPLLVGSVPAATLEALLAAAATAGLASGTNTGYPPTHVADAPDTIFVVWGPAGETRTTFGAFGIEQQPPTQAEAVARDRAATFIDRKSVV